MFKSSSGGCSLCSLAAEGRGAAVGAVGESGVNPVENRLFASVHGRVRAPAARTRNGVALKTSSAFSRESGFQSGTASVCSGNGPDVFAPSSAGKITRKWNRCSSDNLIR